MPGPFCVRRAPALPYTTKGTIRHPVILAHLSPLGEERLRTKKPVETQRTSALSGGKVLRASPFGGRPRDEFGPITAVRRQGIQ
jgi:hypothetical protein